MIENEQQASDQFLRWMTHCNDDPVMYQPCLKVFQCERLEIGPIVSQESPLLTDSVSELFLIIPMKLIRIAGCGS